MLSELLLLTDTALHSVVNNESSDQIQDKILDMNTSKQSKEHGKIQVLYTSFYNLVLIPFSFIMLHLQFIYICVYYGYVIRTICSL